MLDLVHRIHAGFLACLLGLFLAACENGGSEFPNELRGAVTQGGQPAAGVTVSLYSVDYIPADTGKASLALTTRTDAHGRYAFREIPAGRYNLVGKRDSLGFFRDSVSVSSGVDAGADPLRSLGGISGSIRLQPDDDPRNAVVQVMGTDAYVNVDSLGRFTVAGLAEGTYRLRVFAALPDYVPLFREVRVRAGQLESLADPLAPFYGGIPMVEGIRAELDTAAGIATLTWRPVAYPSLFTYLVYRDEAGAANLSGRPLNPYRVLDTVYRDTLYRMDGGSPDMEPHAWEYRVRVKSNGQAIGGAYRSAALNAVPPAILATRISISGAGDSLGNAFRGDTLRLIADYGNPTAGNRSLAWIHGVADTLRKVALAAKEGRDTLTWIASSVPGPDSLRVEVVDGNGKTWTQTARLRIRASRIVSTSLPAGDFEAHAWNGKVVHVGLTGTTISIGIFDPAARRDSLVTSAAATESGYQMYSAYWDSKLYFLNATHPGFPAAGMLSYSLATRTWSAEPGLPGGVRPRGMAAAGGRLYVLTGETVGPWDEGLAGLHSLDLVTGTWASKRTHAARWLMEMREAGGAVYLASTLGSGPYSTTWEKYDAASDTWDTLPASERMQRSTYMRLVAIGGKLYSMGGSFDFANTRNIVERFEPASQEWVAAPELILGRSQPGVVALGDTAYIVGGWTLEDGLSRIVEEYRP